jgi:DNA-binding NtrC family response regulator
VNAARAPRSAADSAGLMLPAYTEDVDGRSAVLVLEDDGAMRMVVRVNLELEGLRCLEAATVEEAERLLHDDDVGVVVTDLKLKEATDGLRFAHKVRDEHPNVGLVIVSGTTPAPAESLDFADALFSKPFALGDFVDTVARLATR